MKLRCAMAIMIAPLAGNSDAQVVQTESGWHCGSISDWEVAQVNLESKVVLNNFLFNERNALIANSLRVVELSYSATNRDTQSAAFNSQAVGFDDKSNLTFAIEANPLLDLLSESSTETISGDSYIDGSVLSRTTNLCIKFLADM